MPATPNPPGTQVQPGTAGQAQRAKKTGQQLAQGQGGQGGVNVQGTPTSPCLISWPKASVPLVGSVGGGCLLSKTNVRAMAGGLMLGAGAVLAGVGLVLLVAAGFKRTGALGKAADMAAVVPGGQAVAAGLHTAQNRATRTGAQASARRSQRRSRAASEERAHMRAVGEPRENSELRTGRGAVRETAAGTRRRQAERDRPPF